MFVNVLDPGEKTFPKLRELEKVLEECRENSEVKVLVFSEWQRMLELVRELCGKLGMGYALHTGSVPQRRRRAEILLFKNDPDCRVFLSTDSGSTGLNLQNASVVINCDLPWNPTRLEQRIARAAQEPDTLRTRGTEKHRHHLLFRRAKSKRSLSIGKSRIGSSKWTLLLESGGPGGRGARGMPRNRPFARPRPRCGEPLAGAG